MYRDDERVSAEKEVGGLGLPAVVWPWWSNNS